ncbi:MAG: NAD-dependent epimerase/dehydratase family protein [Massilia sp.]
MKFIVGARGRLGRALADQFGPDTALSLERGDYQHWGEAGGAVAAGSFLDAHAKPGDTILVASGLLDPALPPSEHAKVNVDLPAHIIEAAAGRDVSVVTFGTVMETLQANPNPYVRSKVALSHIVDRAAASQPLIHIRVHTLYGVGEPSPFMFLGQLLSSLRQRTPFEMTSGRQLREYHHVQDEARAVAALCAAGARGVFDLSSGQPLSLRDLAIGVFDAFGMPELLRLGARPEPAEENYGAVFQPHSALEQGAFRPAIPSVINYLSAYV